MEAKGEIGSTGATDEIAVGILPGRQLDHGDCQARPLESAGQGLGSVLTGSVVVLVKGEVNLTRRRIGDLMELGRCQMCAEGAGGVAKAGLPQHGQVEEAFDQDHGGELANRFPGEQPAPEAWKESVDEGVAETAAIKVDNASVLATREGDAAIEGIATLPVDQAEASQEIDRTALSHEMAP